MAFNVLSVSVQATSLSLGQGYAKDKSERVVIQEGTRSGAGLGTVESLYPFTKNSRFKLDSTQMALRDAGKALSELKGQLGAVATGLQSLRDKAYSATHFNLGDSEVETIVSDVQSLLIDLDSTSAAASFQAKDLLIGDNESLSFQVYDDSYYGFRAAVNEDFAKLKIELQSTLSKDLDIDDISVTSMESSERAVEAIDSAMNKITSFLSKTLELRESVDAKLKVFDRDNLEFHEVKTLAPTINFYTDNAVHRELQIKSLESGAAPILNHRFGLKGASLSIKI